MPQFTSNNTAVSEAKNVWFWKQYSWLQMNTAFEDFLAFKFYLYLWEFKKKKAKLQNQCYILSFIYY